ncbi:hypothetical protein [Arthrobacter sp. 35W]|nr:hypothetical protein [Arthrobacter sp. 35W]
MAEPDGVRSNWGARHGAPTPPATTSHGRAHRRRSVVRLPDI